jgi:small subunit ribosomal protein S13
MLYLFESEFFKNKSIFVSFMQIFGIGKFNSILICKQLGFCKNFKTKKLSKKQINKIIKIFEYLNLQIASELKKIKLLIWKKQILIKSYKGLRKLKGLPVRGQRTHTNSKTSRRLLKYVNFLFNKEK